MKNLVLALTVISAISLWSCGNTETPSNGTQADTATNNTDAAPATETTPEMVETPAAENKIFSFENAKIVFEYGGNWSGQKTVYIDDWGNKILTIDERETKGMNLGQTIVYKDNTVTKWTHMSGNAKATQETKADADLKYLLKFVVLHEQLLQYKSKEQLERGVYKYTGTQDIVGKTCDAFKSEAASTEVWRWNELELYISNSAMKSQAHTVTATSFEEGVEFPEAQCAVPDGFTVEVLD